MNRGISTVMDVSLALLLISASVALIAFAMQDDTVEHEHEQADYTAETFASLTFNVTYSLEPIHEDTDPNFCGCDMFDEDEMGETDSYERSVHGSAPSMVADATVTNAKFEYEDSDEEPVPLTKEGVDYERSLDASFRSRMTGANNQTQVVAIWRPYEGADIEGETTLGSSPPADADVSTAQLVVPSGIPAIEDSRLERAYRLNGYDGAGAVIADAIVRGYFPPEETQLALEASGMRRERVVYRYKRVGNMYDVGWDETSYWLPSVIGRSGADARAANDDVSEEMAGVIADDLEDAYGTSGPSADELADRVSTGEVTILIRTW